MGFKRTSGTPPSLFIYSNHIHARRAMVDRLVPNVRLRVGGFERLVAGWRATDFSGIGYKLVPGMERSTYINTNKYYMLFSGI